MLANNKQQNFQIAAIFFMLLIANTLAATNVVQTKTQLKKLDTKINLLQTTLNQSNNKRDVIHHELALIEKKYSLGVTRLSQQQTKISQTEEQIAKLQQTITESTNKLKQQQQLLATHIRARYLLGDSLLLKSLLNQDNPSTSSQVITRYQYLFKARQKAIIQVQETEKQLATAQTTLQQVLTQQQQLKKQLATEQLTLAANKRGRAAVMKVLTQTIQSKQQQLKEYQANKTNLARLLLTLQQQSKQKMPSIQFIHTKFPKPVAVSSTSIRIVNQGLLFVAREGLPVNAIYPGKVVFSDWLRGYGLLLILDHGRGLMSLYAHNQALFKQKGDRVDQGEQIATVGHSGGLSENGLYFEVRQYGKAISPRKWLS